MTDLSGSSHYERAYEEFCADRQVIGDANAITEFMRKMRKLGFDHLENGGPYLGGTGMIRIISELLSRSRPSCSFIWVLLFWAQVFSFNERRRGRS